MQEVPVPVGGWGAVHMGRGNGAMATDRVENGRSHGATWCPPLLRLFVPSEEDCVYATSVALLVHSTIAVMPSVCHCGQKWTWIVPQR